ncbi:hypothetical protein R3P38DRAFT_2815691 [Favolaschia claudopus]|uniref:Uncharacterized protein n=1 Tax=Favolaschia claudopus TaxID=2862362 RepID=A0AAV9Z0U2_9AGAR
MSLQLLPRVIRRELTLGNFEKNARLISGGWENLLAVEDDVSGGDGRCHGSIGTRRIQEAPGSSVKPAPENPPIPASKSDIFGLKEPLFGEEHLPGFVSAIQLVRTPKFGSSVRQHEIEEEMGRKLASKLPQRATFWRTLDGFLGVKEPLFGEENRKILA